MPGSVIVTAAITGSLTSLKETPYLPVTWDAIVQEAVSSWNAGAAVIHLHARDESGVPTQDPATYRLLMERIRAAGCDAVLNLSTGSAAGGAELDERIACLDLRPEVATLDCGSMNLGEDRVFTNPFSFLRDAAQRMQVNGVVPEIEIFDLGMVRNAFRLLDEGLIEGPGVWQLCLGVRSGAPADIHTVSHLLGRLPEGAVWGMLGVGRDQLPVNLFSLAAGGHLRTGLEDNVYYHHGELARSNAQLVERLVRLAGEVGRPVATPAEARRILGVVG